MAAAPRTALAPARALSLERPLRTPHDRNTAKGCGALRWTTVHERVA